jgi:hypothetical protein
LRIQIGAARRLEVAVDAQYARDEAAQRDRIRAFKLK